MPGRAPLGSESDAGAAPRGFSLSGRRPAWRRSCVDAAAGRRRGSRAQRLHRTRSPNPASRHRRRHALEREECLLAVGAAGVTGERAVAADDPVARHDHRHRVAPDRAADGTHRAVCPELAGEFRRFRDALKKPRTALNVVVSASGALNLSRPVFSSGEVDALIVTTPSGAKRLMKTKVPASVQVRAIRRNAAHVSAAAVLEEVGRVHSTSHVLLEGGPRLLGTFYKERLLDEQFLTLAPQIAGRETGDRRLSLVMGQSFAPRDPLWGTMIDARQGSKLLFLRYQFCGARR